MRLSLYIAAILLATARITAADPTWHLSLQLSSLHEHTIENDAQPFHQADLPPAGR